jgi:peptidoglycan L-alanyl-D-glutamate endopeptidase CwlK
MNQFSRKSLENLSTANTTMQSIAVEVLRIKDHSVLKGHRPKDEQNKAFAVGASQLQWPDGKHNALPSVALDVQTYPVPDGDQALREDQLYLLGLYVGVAYEMGVTLRTGADWDRDGEIADNGFDDFFHVEIIRDENDTID